MYMLCTCYVHAMYMLCTCYVHDMYITAYMLCTCYVHAIYMLCDMLCDMLCASYATYKYAKLHAMYGFLMASAAAISVAEPGWIFGSGWVRLLGPRLAPPPRSPSPGAIRALCAPCDGHCAASLLSALLSLQPAGRHWAGSPSQLGSPLHAPRPGRTHERRFTACRVPS